MNNRVDEIVHACQDKGLKLRCDRLFFILENETFSLYRIKLGRKDLGQWTETAIENILGQLLEPTNPPRWFKDLGIDLEAIAHPSLTIGGKK